MRPQDGVDHLQPELWARATRHLLRKAIAEFAHERLLAPEPDGDGWVVRAGAVTYRFTAQRLALDHWHVDAASITRHRAPSPSSRGRRRPDWSGHPLFRWDGPRRGLSTEGQFPC